MLFGATLRYQGGFVLVGVYHQIGFKFNQWHDVAWLHLRLRDDPRPPSDPLRAADMWHEERVTTMFHACAQSARID